MLPDPIATTYLCWLIHVSFRNDNRKRRNREQQYIPNRSLEGYGVKNEAARGCLNT